jgi:hypothetical protein
MFSRSIKTALLVLPALAVVGCASVSRPNSYGLDSHHAAVVHQTCTEVMGLRAGFAEYDACGDSLAESVRVLNDSRLTVQANAQCQQQGMTPGTSDLAKCVVMSRREQGAASPLQLTALSDSGRAARDSYFSMNRAQQDERMELSCAHLGLHPATTGFNHCVATLRNAIWTVQNPM